MLNKIKHLNYRNKYHLPILSIEIVVLLSLIFFSFNLLLKQIGISSMITFHLFPIFLFLLILSFAYLYHVNNRVEFNHQYLIISSIFIMFLTLVILWK